MPATGRILDPQAYAAAPSVAADHPLLTAEPTWTAERRMRGFQVGAYGNLTKPVCTAAGTMNGIRVVGDLQGFELAVDDAMVDPFYASCAGCQADQASIMASHGAVVATVMQRLEKPGYTVAIDRTFHGFARTIPKNKSAIANAIAAWGWVGAGIGVPSDIVLDGTTWHAEARPTPENHFVPLLSASPYDVEFGTWGAKVLMGWDYLEQSADEFWVVVFPQLVKADGTYLGKPFADLMSAFDA